MHIALPASPDVPPPRYVPDTSRAREELGLRVSVTLQRRHRAHGEVARLDAARVAGGVGPES